MASPGANSFTDHARRVLFFARYEASELGSDTIAPEHLLLGLIRENSSDAARVFADAGIDRERVRQALDRVITVRDKVVSTVEIGLGDDLKQAVDFAAEEAARLGHQHVATGHLLLGLLRLHGSVAERALAEVGLEASEAQAAVARWAPEPTE